MCLIPFLKSIWCPGPDGPRYQLTLVSGPDRTHLGKEKAVAEHPQTQADRFLRSSLLLEKLQLVP